MIREVIKYVKHCFEVTKQKYEKVNDVILKSALVYQYLYHRNFETYIPIHTIQRNRSNWSWKWCFTHFLERIFNQSDILHSQSILHDAFGRFYDHHQLDRGYTYVIPKNRTPKCIKRSPLCGQSSGLIYCVSKKNRNIKKYKQYI